MIIPALSILFLVLGWCFAVVCMVDQADYLINLFMSAGFCLGAMILVIFKWKRGWKKLRIFGAAVLILATIQLLYLIWRFFSYPELYLGPYL